jgi:hypothetical protein
MARNSTFLLRSREPCLPSDHASVGTSTETRAREERDQDHPGGLASFSRYLRDQAIWGWQRPLIPRLLGLNAFQMAISKSRGGCTHT